MSFASRYRVEPGKNFSLASADPGSVSGLKDKKAALAELKDDAKAIHAWSGKLRAEGRHSLLVVLQGMDAAGKDGVVADVFGETGPLGASVHSFKAPSAEELSHDYLWRVHNACPPAGMIGIFNRSHYEDVLVVRVHAFAPAADIEKRYDQINNFEKMLSENGTRILKFMLNVSFREQGVRLQERIDDPEKQWKFNPGDLKDRALWDEFQKAYDIALSLCSTSYAPWHVIPSDRNWVRNSVIGRIVRETLEEMNPQYPPLKGWDPKTMQI